MYNRLWSPAQVICFGILVIPKFGTMEFKIAKNLQYLCQGKIE
jgi:hypothetical protein